MYTMFKFEMLSCDPHDALLSADPPELSREVLQRADLGHYTGGHIDKWTWDELEVWDIHPDVCTALYWLLKSLRGVKEPPHEVIKAIELVASIRGI